jgi:transcriptional regulator with XRE-family HTH domain
MLPEPIGYSFGQRLREMREKVGLTQTALAEDLGVSHQLVSGWERETRNPKLEDVVRIASRTGCDPAYVFSLVSSAEVVE